MFDKKESTKLQKNEYIAYLEGILSLMPGHVYWLDRNNVYVGCNREQAKAFGLSSPDEVTGKTNYDFIKNRTEARAVNAINLSVMESGESYTYEESVTLQNEERTYLSQKVSIKNRENTVVGIVGISFDITDRKRMEEALKEASEKADIANHAKTEFLENMRHDIRTPLSGIVGLSEAINREENKDHIKEHAALLMEASQELLRFLNEVLESINIASGHIPLLKRKFNLIGTLENLIKLHKPKALEKRLELILAIDPDIPTCFIGDPVRIYRVVLELLVNALKFTQAGSVKVSARIGKKEGREFAIQIFVEDTGLGIPLEKQQDLFVRFKRLTPSYEGIYRGSGLGLSIAKEFLDDLKGEMDVESVEGVGTKFVCVIPLVEPLLDNSFVGSAPLTTVNTMSESKRSQCMVKKNGLIVEDQPIAAAAVKILFEQQSCQMEVAINGQTAIDLANRNAYHFIILDIGLPDLDGYTVAKAIRMSLHSSGARPLIVGLTGHLETGQDQLSIAAGMDLVFIKPLTQEMMTMILGLVK